MTPPRLAIRVSQLDLHPATLLILGDYYPKPSKGEHMLTLDDAIRWQALDTWVRYKEYLMNLAKGA